MLLLLAILFIKRQRLPQWLMATLLLAEVLVLNLAIAFNGAASNPFSAILLIPVVLAFMLLPLFFAVGILVISVIAQISQLLMLSAASHHGRHMFEHYYGMVFGFVLTSLLIGLVICYFRRQIAKREDALYRLRERQLRDEQLLALGTAAAQMTHDVATPVQSMQLLLEEAGEMQPQPGWLLELNQQFARIQQHLNNWREVANDVRENRSHDFLLSEVWQELKKLMLIARPESSIDWLSSGFSKEVVRADRTLFSSLTSVIVNACQAASTQVDTTVRIRSEFEGDCWLLSVENLAAELSSAELDLLGSQIVDSAEGHGVGAILSNATLERFNGEVSRKIDEQALTTLIRLPYRLADEVIDN